MLKLFTSDYPWPKTTGARELFIYHRAVAYINVKKGVESQS